MNNTLTTRNIPTLGTNEVRLLFSPGSQLHPPQKWVVYDWLMVCSLKNTFSCVQTLVALLCKTVGTCSSRWSTILGLHHLQSSLLAVGKYWGKSWKIWSHPHNNTTFCRRVTLYLLVKAFTHIAHVWLGSRNSQRVAATPSIIVWVGPVILQYFASEIYLCFCHVFG